VNAEVDVANKNVGRIIEKMVENKDWPNKLLFTLWGYKKLIRICRRATPYSLVYEMEAVLQVEIAISSPRVIVESQISELE